ncbi:Collagen alpha-1(III) chain like [Quillaja saponaria]|uniref:Collagen alpha-1(III) chain like n=1 Tax=Quillaja saponaria TaxID=32244 RepID=A0AAD7PGX2_QUISA|nr:Collagen alpha-1(III) chain like [Quillaja saponaria]KAJ7955138.1 Collagen alpha-1(III) chain like [Quillaja saponaria]
MSNKSPIFPMPDPQHFSDYGFDPQIGYLQVLEEAMKHKRETSRPLDSIHFRLQKPIYKDDSKKPDKAKRKRWWKNALLFFKWRRTDYTHRDNDDDDVHQAMARAYRASVSGPVYMTESTSGCSTPYRTTSRPSSGPLSGTLTPLRKGEVDIPYLSLSELTMEKQQQQRMSTSAMPVYLVT